MAIPRKRAPLRRRLVAERPKVAIHQGTDVAPVIRTMRRATCVALLQRHAVGRMAFSFHDRVDITPIHYVFADGWLFARTSHGAKLTTLRHSPWVAFEVDEVEGIFDWRSVVARGTAYAMRPDAGRVEAARWNRAVAQLRRLIPETATPIDPVPFRSVVFGIHIDSMTGRASSSGRSAKARRTAAPG